MKRILFVLVGLVLALSLVWASGQDEEQAPAAQQPAAEGEAPMLAELVDAGELPPVEERLPVNPVVVTPEDEIGQYGGTITRGTVNLSGYLLVINHSEPLIEYQYPFRGSGEPLPNLAESATFNDEGTVLTIRLREGLKWSDGTPYTMDDVEFLINDIWLDEGVAVTFPGALRADGQIPEFNRVDDRTFTFTYHRPFFYATWNLAAVSDFGVWPKHHVSEYHPRYNDEASYESFAEDMEDYWPTRGQVTMLAWMIEEYEPGQRISLVRNPYYFKVDTAGNQLPYADRHVYRVIEDRPQIALSLIAGELDLDGMWVGAPQLPLFMSEREERGFTVGWYEGTLAVGFYFNLDHPDPAKREVFRNREFRRAFSIALDRAEISRTFYYDQLEPTGTMFTPITPYYDEDAAQLWADHDPELARQMLDEAGFRDRDGDGFREALNGEPLELIIDVSQHDLYVPLTEMVVEQLADVGINSVLNIQHHSAIGQRRETFEYDIHVWDADGIDRPLDATQFFIPSQPNTPHWHHRAATDPISDEYSRFVEIFNRATSVPFDEHAATMKEAGRLLANNVWFAYVGNFRRPYFIGPRVGNVPEVSHRVPSDYQPWRAYQIYVKE